MSAAPTPYNARETLGLLWRNLAGPGLANPAGVSFAPQHATLNAITPAARIGFAGDIMMMFGRRLEFGAAITDFFAGCDHLVANLEGVITDQPKRGPDQKHTPAIIDALATLTAPERFALSVANNHCGDFGADACRASMTQFSGRGFRLFGLADTPFLDLAPQVRVVTGTQWSNRAGEHLAWLRQPEQHRRAGALNILFPHWGHEMLCYPRPELVQQAQTWLPDFDAIIGHHSHTPQPVSVLPDPQPPGRARLVAWSLGDFCFGLGHKRWPALRHYPWGIVAKVTVGPLQHDPATWALGELHWQFTDCAWQPDRKTFVTDLVPRIPYFATR